MKSSAPTLVPLLLVISCFWDAAHAWTSSEICGTDVTWTYEPVSGKCWTLPWEVMANTTQLITLDSARKSCMEVSGGLPAPGSMTDMVGMQQFLTTNGLAADVWTDLKRMTVGNYSGYFYPDGNQTVSVNLWLDGAVPSSSSMLNCAVYSSRVEPQGDGSWTRKMGFAGTLCSSAQATVCYKNVTQCQATDPPYISLVNMSAINISYGQTLTNRFHIGLRQDVQCKTGFFRPRDSPSNAVATPPATSDGLAVNQAECFPGTDGTGPTLKASTIETCQITMCPTAHLKRDTKIPNVEPYEQTLTKDYYLYGESFHVNCSQGHVSYLNLTSVNSSLTCGFSDSDKTRYEWVPPDLNACQPVSCPPVQSVMREYMSAFKAYDRLRSKEYNEFQQSSFPYYPNRVHVKCSETGAFFDDRAFTKVVSCDLRNGSITEGTWYGVLGTSLTRLSTTHCIPVSCQSDVLLARSRASADFLKDLSYANTTVILFLNGSSLTVDTGSVNAVELYTFGTVLQFSCQQGYSTGVGPPVAYCSDTGLWNLSRLPTCTKTSETVVPKGKHYVPPSVEADGADSIGAIAIVVCVIFGVFIVILDLSTLSRDLVLIRKNIRRLKRRMAANKRQKLTPTVDQQQIDSQAAVA